MKTKFVKTQNVKNFGGNFMIEKIAKRLKRFTLVEIELIADIDCSDLINALIKESKIKVCGKFYEYIEPKIENFKYSPSICLVA